MAVHMNAMVIRGAEPTVVDTGLPNANGIQGATSAIIKLKVLAGCSSATTTSTARHLGQP